MNREEAKLVVQTPVLSLPPSEVASSRAWSRPHLSRFCLENEALGHVYGGGLGFTKEGSCGHAAASFSMADSCSHPHGRGHGCCISLLGPLESRS